MTNCAAHPADFKCSLRAQGHRPQRMQVYRLGKNPDRKVYRVVDGEDLMGKDIWLVLDELNGPRTLKYRFVAGAQAPDQQGGSNPSSAVNALPTKPEDSTPAQPNEKRPPLASAKS